VLRRIHNRDVDQSGGDLIDKISRDVNVNAQGDISQRSAQPEDPIEQKRWPQIYLAADSQDSATPGRDRDLMTHALP
jgi:hypothetical protein